MVLDSLLINRREYYVFANGLMTANQYGFRRELRNQLNRKNCLRNLARTTNAYSSDREAIIEEPGLINILHDSIFELDLGEGCEIIPFEVRRIHSRAIEIRCRLVSEIHPSETGAIKFSKNVAGRHERPQHSSSTRATKEYTRNGAEGNERANELAKEVAAGVDDGTPLAYTFVSEKPVKGAIEEVNANGKRGGRARLTSDKTFYWEHERILEAKSSPVI
ncbi:hypothetical protein Trydic_g12961 [Trypoxylus dichotomus]